MLGVGTEEGARVPAPKGGWVLDRSGEPVRTALNEKLLEELAHAGGGTYQLADYRAGDTRKILEAAAVRRLPPEAGDERTRVWNDRFYLPLLAIAALLVPNFRGRARLRPKT